MTVSAFEEEHKIFDLPFISCYTYSIRAHSTVPWHFHRALEIMYVISGSCQTHKQHHLYLDMPGHKHQFVNDTNSAVKIMCLTIPRETNDNTIYLEE